MITTKISPFLRFTWLFLVIGATALAQNSSSDSALEMKISHFELTNQTLFDGLSQLSNEPLPLQLGFEEVLKQHDSDQRDAEPRFNVKFDNATVRTILDSLCSRDARYTWSTDGSVINVYPKAVQDDPSYLLNRKISSIKLDNVTDPYKVLTPIAQQLPIEQIGYRHLGGDVKYPSPWSTKFENLTVRQIMNRVTAHLGARGGWTFFGSKQNRWFTFHSGYFGRLEATTN